MNHPLLSQSFTENNHQNTLTFTSAWSTQSSKMKVHALKTINLKKKLMTVNHTWRMVYGLWSITLSYIWDTYLPSQHISSIGITVVLWGLRRMHELLLYTTIIIIVTCSVEEIGFLVLDTSYQFSRYHQKIFSPFLNTSEISKLS